MQLYKYSSKYKVLFVLSNRIGSATYNKASAIANIIRRQQWQNIHYQTKFPQSCPILRRGLYVAGHNL